MRWCQLDTKLFALCIWVLVVTELVVSGTQYTKHPHNVVYGPHGSDRKKY